MGRGLRPQSPHSHRVGPEKGVRKEDYVRPRLRQMERRERFGVYFILKSMEG